MDTVLITGTTSGIGKAFAEKFAEMGNRIILVSRNSRRLQQQRKELQCTYDVPVHCIACDLTREDAAAFIMERIGSMGLPVDILINNAGFNEAGPFAETSLRMELDMIRVHITALTALTKGVLPGMIERRHGRILNVGSTGAYMPCPGDAVYAATKSYILSFTSALSQELQGTGVTVTCLCPGATQTPFAAKANLEGARLFRFRVMQPEAVAAIGCRHLQKGTRTVTAGICNRLQVFFARLLPAGVVSRITQWMMEP